MRPNKAVDASIKKITDNPFFFFWVGQSGKRFHADWKVLEALFHRSCMLFNKNRRWSKKDRLLVIHRGAENGAECNFGLSESDITREHPVHRPAAFKIGENFFNRFFLVRRFLIGE